MSEEQDERRVISLFDREPVAANDLPTVELSVEDDKPRADPDTIETLQMALDMARSGDVTGCVVILGLNLCEADRSVVTDTTQLIGFNVPDNITLFLGALEQAKYDIIELRNEYHADED